MAGSPLLWGSVQVRSQHPSSCWRKLAVPNLIWELHLSRHTGPNFGSIELFVLEVWNLHSIALSHV